MTFNDLPHIDVHLFEDHFKLINQGNVHGAENIFH